MPAGDFVALCTPPQEEVLSLPPPYETMCSQYDSKGGEFSYADGVVQSEECSSKCIADNWQQHCSCFSKLYSVKHRRKGPICEYIDHREFLQRRRFLSTAGGFFAVHGQDEEAALASQLPVSLHEALPVHVTVVMGSHKKKTIYTFPRIPMEDLMIYIGGHVDMWLGFALIGVCGVVLDFSIKCSKWFSRSGARARAAAGEAAPPGGSVLARAHTVAAGPAPLPRNTCRNRTPRVAYQRMPLLRTPGSRPHVISPRPPRISEPTWKKAHACVAVTA
ncbi:hypothetical protein HPB48_026277 [Haemaphysalis longicornis]|uniref:Amiloride-sensitive sodium channel n=1 Tax=Haemaphysalis longicornis TaxID=44386 RepID=A0A9J6H987_HAELO|nr:hypothetical protein HPB48_026277 [Haemaphysalis longicornis]